MALKLIRNTASQNGGFLYKDDKSFSSYVSATVVITSNQDCFVLYQLVIAHGGRNIYVR